ncbi:hypothetical protein J4219_00735 [Candidatus Woesearchaeota archaeon]|nr:hypothetical protein [Candidatus Woesearchaeota archaeon]
MSISKKVLTYAKFGLVKWIARLFYVAGLTSLIPLIPLLLFPEHLATVKVLLVFSIAFVCMGFLLLLWYTQSFKRTIFNLGIMTLIPGLLAVIFTVLGEKKLILFVASFGKLSPLIQTYVQNYVPKGWFLAGTYILLGTLLAYFGEK